MMKKMMMAIAMMVFAMSASAQREPGTLTIQPKVGFNVSILYMDDKNVDNEGRGGNCDGVELEYQIKKWFSLSAGVLYSQDGGKFKLKEQHTTEEAHLDYIHVPVLANFYVWKGLALKIGLQPGFKVREKLYPSVNGIVLPEKYQFGDKADGFDLRLPLGISYDFGGVVLEFRTSSGLVKTFKDKDYTNASATLSIGYKFKLK